MPLDKTYINKQKELKNLLLKDGRKTASKFENLVAALVSRLLGVPLFVASSGSQYGADAGTAGQQGRFLRIECKKYSESSKLKEAELLGKISQALQRDELLEVWVLVSTCRVSEQIRKSLDQEGEEKGISVLILDWPDSNELTPIAALCAFAPDLVESKFSREASKAALFLQPISEDIIKGLRTNMQSWCLGFETLRTKSHQKLESIWKSPQEAKTSFGQNVAGGAQDKRIKRSSVHKILTNWWQNSAIKGVPVAVVGLNGVGKTWTILDWLIENRDEQPIILTIPSSSTTTISSITKTSVKQFLADCLYNITEVKNSEHWLHRLNRLLARPTEEGPVMTIFFDGLNQEPSTRWIDILNFLQSETFSKHLRIIVSTRNHHFQNKLLKLSNLYTPPMRVDIDPFNTAPGDELDQMLELEGLKRTDLHADTIEIISNPRFFSLMMKFGKNLIKEGQITPHRLLWEYGRNTFGERAKEPFSEAERETLLKELANRFRDGEQEFSVKSLADMVNSKELNSNEVYVRLSDLIDHQLTKHNKSGEVQFNDVIVAHAIGAALLNRLEKIDSETFETLENNLMEWLDPIEGFDQKAEILRASMSILVAQGYSAEKPISGVLVTSWLQTQNIPEEHQQELVGLAPNFPSALLDAIEHSNNHAHASARNWAVKAIRATLEANDNSFSLVAERACLWLARIYRNLTESIDTEESKWRSNHFKQIIGTDRPGPITVLGKKFELVDHNFDFF